MDNKYINNYTSVVKVIIDELLTNKFINSINKLGNVMGLEIDMEANKEITGFKEKDEGLIPLVRLKVDAYVTPTNEEYMILKDIYDYVKENIKEQTISLKRGVINES